MTDQPFVAGYEGSTLALLNELATKDAEIARLRADRDYLNEKVNTWTEWALPIKLESDAKDAEIAQLKRDLARLKGSLIIEEATKDAEIAELQEEVKEQSEAQDFLLKERDRLLDKIRFIERSELKALMEGK